MASLAQTRCFNHDQREAVARCPGCRRHFCRECVTEHDHRLLCASCLEAEAVAPEERPALPIPFRGMAQLAAAVFVLWIAFYILGQALLLIPSEFHHTVDDFQEEMGLDVPEGGSNGGENDNSEGAPV